MALPATNRYQFSVADYDRMIEVGIIREGDRVELVEGEIVRMAAMGQQHAACVRRANRLLSKTYSDLAYVDVQCPIVVNEHSEPEPDLALLNLDRDFYKNSHPRPADVLLLIEISDSSLLYDRNVKLPLYARAGVSEVWLVDLEGDKLTVFGDPTPDGYRASRTVGRGDWLAPLAFPGREIAVSDILG